VGAPHLEQKRRDGWGAEGMDAPHCRQKRAPEVQDEPHDGHEALSVADALSP